MFHIDYAKLEDAEEVLSVTKQAFEIYRDNLHSNTEVAALKETLEKTKEDITAGHILLAKNYGVVMGCIRFEKLTCDLAYIYRFSVLPTDHNSGVGSMLLDYALKECQKMGYKTVCLHTNAKYFTLARYYYGREFYVHSTCTEKGYIRALFVKELTEEEIDLSMAFTK